MMQNSKKKKTVENKKNPEEIEVPVWWSTGSGISYRRDSLSISHPENTYNYIKNKLGLVPENYGINHPAADKYATYSRAELINLIVQLEEALENKFMYDQ